MAAGRLMPEPPPSAEICDAINRNGQKRVNAGLNGRREQDVAAEPDIGLLADRDEPGIAGEQVPEARERDIGVDFGEKPQVVASAPGRRGGKQHQGDGERGGADPARAARMLDVERRGHPCTFGNRPSGRTARMMRKARCPAKSCQPGLICAPIACDAPRMMPPASVPHMLPRPPMMTASKPKISRAGPIAGSKLVRTAMKTPATAMTASESAMASAKI